MNYEVHYTGGAYPGVDEIKADAKRRGYTHAYWASEIGYSGLYNGDVVVVYNSTDGMNEAMEDDADRYGKAID